MQEHDGELDFSALIQELGIDKMPAEQQEKLMGDILDTINMRVLSRLLDDLTEEQAQHIRTIADLDPYKVYNALLAMTSGDRLTQVYQEEIDGVKEDIKRKMNDVPATTDLPQG